MLSVVSRIRSTDVGFLDAATAALEVLAVRPGWLGGRVGRAADDDSAWVIITDWADVGSWRRASSAAAVRPVLKPVLVGATDEPSAFEVLAAVAAGGAAPTQDTSDLAR